MVLGSGLVRCPDCLDSADLLLGRTVQNQLGSMGIDPTVLRHRWRPSPSSLAGSVSANKASKYVNGRAVALITSNSIQFAH